MKANSMKTVFSLMSVLLFFMLFSGYGCSVDVDDDDDDFCQDCFYGGDIEGSAYFPYSERSEYWYYPDGNYGITVSLHDRSGAVIREYFTDDDGYFSFYDIYPGYYYLVAYIEEYEEVEDLYHVFEAESVEFYLADDEIARMDLYLEPTGYFR